MKRALVLAIFAFLAQSLLGQDASGEKILPRWKWHGGDTFVYKLQGDVVSSSGTANRSLVTSTITVSASDEKLAVFTNSYNEIKWNESGTWYSATKEGLVEHAIGFVIDASGKVNGNAKEKNAKNQEYIDTLMPLPPKPVSVGSFWEVNFKESGLRGVCEFSGYEKRGERNCAVFKMELASPERIDRIPVRECEAEFYFDVEEGCFVHVHRRIEVRGTEKKDEKLTIDLVSSPKQKSAIQKEQAVTENLENRVRRHPQDTALMRELSDQYARLGKVQKAIEMIDRIIAVESENSGALTRKGELLLAGGDEEGALDFFRKAVARERTDTRALLGGAQASFQLGKYDDCARYSRMALGEDGKSPYQAYYTLGAALAKLGRLDEARKAIEKYVELNPNIDKSDKPVIAFTKNNDLNLVARRTNPIDIDKRLKYTPQELAEGREMIKALIKEESVRLRLGADQVAFLLDYLAGLYGKKAPEMVADFLADRQKTYKKIYSSLESESRLPQARLEKLASADDLEPVTMEALLSMMEPEKALQRLEALFESRGDVARFHYLRGRYYMTNPKKFGRKAVKFFELAAMFDEKNALYKYALALMAMKTRGDVEKMLEILAARNLDFGAIESQRIPVVKERLRILRELEYNDRIRRITAWTIDDRADVKIVREMLNLIVGIGRNYSGKKLYSVGAVLAELAYYTTLEMEEKALSAILLVTARSVREASLDVLVEICKTASADGDEPDRDKYRKDLEIWRGRLNKLEKENLYYLKGYVAFLRRCEQAFQVEPYTDPSGSDAFLDRLMKDEIAVMMEKVKEAREKELEKNTGVKKK